MLKQMEDGKWIEVAQQQYIDRLTYSLTQNDNKTLTTLLKLVSSKRVQFTFLLGEMNLNNHYDWA